MSDKIETRMVKINDLRVDAAADWPIDGYPAIFGELSEPLYGFREKIRAGAFQKTIAEADIRGLFNHDPNYVLGRNKAGTMLLEEDLKGLHMRIRPPEAQWANDLVASMKRGDIDQGSFQFKTIRDEWDQSNPKDVIRTLVELKLVDVSVVTFPAYRKTKVHARADALLARLHSNDPTDGDAEEIRSLIAELEEYLNETPSAPADSRTSDHPEEGEDAAGKPAGGPAKAKLARMRNELALRERSL